MLVGIRFTPLQSPWMLKLAHLAPFSTLNLKTNTQIKTADITANLKALIWAKPGSKLIIFTFFNLDKSCWKRCRISCDVSSENLK